MRRLLVYCAALLLGVPAASASPVRDSVEVSTAQLADAIIGRARQFLGTPYKWAASGPKAFDCTGFTKYIYADFGYKLGRTVPAQSRNGREVTGGFENLQKGDILIFGKRHNKKAMGHTAIYIGPDASGDNFTFIHAARGGVMVSEYRETYYRERFLGAVRILPDFVPEPPQDSIDLSPVAELVVAPDTLKLGPEDRRIVLLESGGWVFVEADGSLTVPEGNGALVLYADGQWRQVQPSTKRIPRLEEALQAPVTPETETTAEGAQYHTIKSGDTLSGLAKRYHTTVDKLCQLNGITRKTTLRVGKKIRVK